MSWTPPFTIEEKIKHTLIPPNIYLWFRMRKEMKKGEKEIHLLPNLVDRARHAIDVGANKGVYTYRLSQLCSKVYAYEANPKLLKILEKVSFKNVEIRGIALSNHSGFAELRIPQKNGRFSNQGSSLNPLKVKDHYKGLNVQTRKLDDENLHEIGFIKIDVEGHELAVLEGAKETLQREKPNLLIEVEEKHTQEKLETLHQKIESYGYQGFFCLDQELLSISCFDYEKYHRHPQNPDEYIYNFIFKPR